MNLILIILQLIITKAIQIDAAYSDSKYNLAAYWGQGPYQESLGTYCEQNNMDIVLLSFLNDFSVSRIGYNFGNACNPGSQCKQIAEDINKCQELGVKVLLSIGGSYGNYLITSDFQAKIMAQSFYSMFGPTGHVFPGAQLDGIDLDIEQNSDYSYVTFIKETKRLFGKDFLVSAAPQCVFPDEHIGDALQYADIDIAFIQFYNNYCNLDKKEYNFEIWVNATQHIFKNKQMKLYIGIPGSVDGASTGYVPLSTVSYKSIQAATSSNSFGGIMTWDILRASKNRVSFGTSQNATDGIDEGDSKLSYLEGLSKILNFLNNMKTESYEDIFGPQTGQILLDR